MRILHKIRRHQRRRHLRNGQSIVHGTAGEAMYPGVADV